MELDKEKRKIDKEAVEDTKRYNYKITNTCSHVSYNFAISIMLTSAKKKWELDCATAAY